MNKNWIRVSRNLCCPICGKPDWCLIAKNGTAVICGRTKSDRPTGDAGYLHLLKEADHFPYRPRFVKRREKQATSCVDLDALHQRCQASLRSESLDWISSDLGISVGSIRKFEVGYNSERNVYSFPMRCVNSSICGIRYRMRSGKKFSETGSKQGLFFAQNSLQRDYLLIVEGPTDAMAVHDCGFTSVIGRANCRGNSLQIVSLLRRLRPRSVIIIPDNDGPGIVGASLLGNDLRLQVEAKPLLLPEGIKDIRACIQEKKNADWLADRIGESITSTHLDWKNPNE